MRLLILDDDPDVAATMAFIAQREGYQVHTAKTPSSFFEAAANWRPTHLILDLMMPEADGVEIIRGLAASESTATLILCSGVDGRVLEAAARTAAGLGLNLGGYISKPFLPARLRQLLSTPVRPPTQAARFGRAPGQGQHEVSRAINAQELTAFFQPQVRCSDGSVVGFEALARWPQLDGAVILPDQFIPLAERDGVLGQLTFQIYEYALRWASEPGVDRSIGLSINVSPSVLAEGDLTERFSDLCHRYDIPSSQIMLEITETDAMSSKSDILPVLTRLRLKGFRLAIDDFGTGYSSLARLVRLPFSEIKIDKSFVMGALKSRDSAAIVRAIIGLGRSLEMSVVAEGVEDQETLQFLRDSGCDVAQGFLFAKAMPGPIATNWLTSYAASSGAT